jgi:hypothetical protein
MQTATKAGRQSVYGKGIYRDRHGNFRFEFLRDGRKFQRSGFRTPEAARAGREQLVREVEAGKAPPRACRPRPAAADVAAALAAAYDHAGAAPAAAGPVDPAPPGRTESARLAGRIVEAWDLRDWRWLMGDDDEPGDDV